MQTNQTPAADNTSSAHGSAGRATAIWASLFLSTLFAWAVAKLGLGGTSVMAMLFGLAFAKGTLVILDYMAIRRAPTLWRVIMLGWLAAVCLIITLGYLKGLG